MDKPLLGFDYMIRGTLELQSHPDYSEEAFRNVAAISKMTTKELANLI